MAQLREMTTGPSLPLIFNFTLPLLLGNLLQQLIHWLMRLLSENFLG